MFHALPVPADVGTFTLSDRAEVRVRAPDPAFANANITALDLETVLDARAAYAAHNATYTAAYMPRISFLDVNTSASSLSLLHNALAQGEWRSGHVTILVKDLAAYGSLAFESLATLPAPGSAPTQPPPGGMTGPAPPVTNAQFVPTVQTLTYASNNAAVSSTLTLKPWILSGTVGYQLSGGADGTAQKILPFQNGPLFQALADDRVAPRDHMVTLANALESSFSPIGTDVRLVQAEEQWRHAWTRKTDAMLSAGVFFDSSRGGSTVPYVNTVGPTAEASLQQRFGPSTSQTFVGIDFRLSPVIDQFTGLADERGQATASSGWSHRHLTLRATATGALSTDQSSVSAARIFMGEIDGSYAMSQVLSFDVGARLLAENFNQYPQGAVAGPTTPIVQTAFNQGVVFLAVTVRAIKAHF